MASAEILVELRSVAMRCNACGDRAIFDLHTEMTQAKRWTDSHYLPRVVSLRMALDGGPARWSLLKRAGH